MNWFLWAPSVTSAEERPPFLSPDQLACQRFGAACVQSSSLHRCKGVRGCRTLAPSDPGSASSLRAGMRSIRRPEEAGGGRGSSRLSPCEPTLTLHFLPKWSPSAAACGLCAAGVRDSRGAPVRSGPELRGRRKWARPPCLGRPAVSAWSPGHVPLSFPRMAPHSRPLSSAAPPPLFSRTLAQSSQVSMLVGS